MKILVTGASGFVGRRLVEALELKGHQVTSLVRHSSNPNYPSGDVVITDLTDSLSMFDVVTKTKPDIVVHLGARTPVSYSFSQQNDYQHQNYLGTVNVVNACVRQVKVPRLVFASTMESYGWQPEGVLIKETAQQNPASPYAVAKVAGEHYVRMAGVAYKLPYVIVRCCNTYGGKRFDRNYSLIEYATSTMLKGEDLYIGTPNAVRDFIHVDDHVKAYMHVIGSDKTGIFNFGSEITMTIGEVVEKIKSMLNYGKEIIKTFPPGYPNRNVVENWLSLDSTKARKEFGWKPMSFDEGLKKTIDYWRSYSA